MDTKIKKLPKIGLLYLDYVLRFFHQSNFKGWSDKIETVTYHWGDDKARFINEVKRKKIEVLIGNIPATAYETFKEIAVALPHVRFVPSLESQFPNKSKENVTLFCEKHDLSAPYTAIFYNKEEAYNYLETCEYPKIIKRSYGASNYGGYYVHKVDSKEEAIALFEEKKYMPYYIQDAIPLKADLRVMLVGHKPVCAFWRVAGSDQWITNTSQGGYIDYNKVPMGALELAVEASRAAKAEYWACDIAEHDGNFYILELATAFAAFPYIRDWIGQYLMWDLSSGKYPKPHIPLYNWEEIGKMSPSILRTIRHLSFSQSVPQTTQDGDVYVTDNSDNTIFPMEVTEESKPEDIPENPYLPKIPKSPAEMEIPEKVLSVANRPSTIEDKDSKIDLSCASVTELLTLPNIDEDVALKIKELIDENIISQFSDLEKLEFISEEQLALWKNYFVDETVIQTEKQ